VEVSVVSLGKLGIMPGDLVTIKVDENSGKIATISVDGGYKGEVDAELAEYKEGE